MPHFQGGFGFGRPVPRWGAAGPETLPDRALGVTSGLWTVTPAVEGLGSRDLLVRVALVAG